jgi:hypothetical protein
MLDIVSMGPAFIPLSVGKGPEDNVSKVSVQENVDIEVIAREDKRTMRNEIVKTVSGGPLEEELKYLRGTGCEPVSKLNAPRRPHRCTR